MGYRLSNDLVDDLTWYFNDAEAALGVRSSHGSTVARLLRSSLPDPVGPPVDPGAALERWRLATPDERRAIRAERWAREDDALRLYWQTMEATDDGHSIGETSIDGNVSARARRIHTAMTILVKSHSGPEHERVLFRVYGDPRHAIVSDERDRLRGYAGTADAREALLVEASRAYEAAHAEAMGEERAQGRRRRRSRLDVLLRGGVGEAPPPNHRCRASGSCCAGVAG
jgi:hypothetical protein